MEKRIEQIGIEDFTTPGTRKKIDELVEAVNTLTERYERTAGYVLQHSKEMEHLQNTQVTYLDNLEVSNQRISELESQIRELNPGLPTQIEPRNEYDALGRTVKGQPNPAGTGTVRVEPEYKIPGFDGLQEKLDKLTIRPSEPDTEQDYHDLSNIEDLLHEYTEKICKALKKETE